mgnify:CR=1 FL=1
MIRKKKKKSKFWSVSSCWGKKTWGNWMARQGGKEASSHLAKQHVILRHKAQLSLHRLGQGLAVEQHVSLNAACAAASQHLQQCTLACGAFEGRHLSTTACTSEV